MASHTLASGALRFRLTHNAWRISAAGVASSHSGSSGQSKEWHVGEELLPSRSILKMI